MNALKIAALVALFATPAFAEDAKAPTTTTPAVTTPAPKAEAAAPAKKVSYKEAKTECLKKDAKLKGKALKACIKEARKA